MSIVAPSPVRAERRPRVVSCSGATLPARLAARIAARLASLEPGIGGDDVIAIDGCASACASRRLLARGVSTRAVSLEGLGCEPGAEIDERASDALLGRVVERLIAGDSGTCRDRTPRREPPSPGAGTSGAHTTDDYLYAVYTLTSPVVSCGAVAADLPTLAAHVARVLSVSRAAAGEMLGRLEGRGLIERGPGKEILLTNAGRSAAELVVRRHRVVERFLTDVLGYAVTESHDLALRIRAGFDEAVVERLETVLAPSRSCPHGWPFDPAAESAQLADLVALRALPVGSVATAVAFAEHDAELLGRLGDLGLEPGARVEVLDATSEGRLVSVEGGRCRLDAVAAAAVLVRARV